MSQSDDAAFESAKRAFVAGDLAAAERRSRAMIAADGRDARPWIILADIELRRGQAAAAERWAERACGLDPGNPFARVVLCKSLIALGRLAEAAAQAEAVVSSQRCPPAALHDFGLLFSQLGRHDRAYNVFARAAGAEPDNPMLLYDLAVAERTFGRLEDSERHCDQVIALDPGFYRAWFIRGDLRRQTVERNHVAEMRALIARGIADPEGEILLHYALGKEYEDLGDHAAAFRHFRAGAAIQRKQRRYDVKSNIAVIDRVIRAQTRAALDACPPGFGGDDPIFIVGLPRSGTSLVERVVAGHSAVHGAGELGAFPAALIRAAKQAGVTRSGDWVERLTTLDLAALGQTYARLARETGVPPGRRFTDKFPPNYLYCGAIGVALPRARTILVRRRPMDACFALYKAHFAAGSYPYSYDLDDLARYCAAFQRLAAHWRAVMPGEALLEVQYEDIVADLEGQSRRVMSFLGLPWEDQILRFHESPAPVATASAVQVRRPIYASSIRKWRNYAAELEPLRARLAELMPGEDLG